VEVGLMKESQCK